jgi:predicted nucleotidyltransferase component of viral defense system
VIDPKTHTFEWIEAVAKQHHNADKILIEKAIRALTLLTELKNTGLDFVFKGGTALMLMLGNPKRLSIDIDIILPDKTLDIESLFEKIILNGNFIKFQQHERIVNSNIEKAHYKFFYIPSHKTHSAEEYILLDILFENVPYSQLTEIPIASPFLAINGGPDKITVPTLENIMGDKLTAFPPNTTGIPYFKKDHSMSMEILKQLYDIGNLFDVVTDIAEVKETFFRIAKTELVYRKLNNQTPADVLDDIVQTAFCISTRGAAGIGNFDEIQKGIERVKQFIISERFLIDNTIVAASKAAYMATLIKSGNNEIKRFVKSVKLTDINITNPTYNKLNKLKKNNSEAFWYWYQTIELFKESLYV